MEEFYPIASDKVSPDSTEEQPGPNRERLAQAGTAILNLARVFDLANKRDEITPEILALADSVLALGTPPPPIGHEQPEGVADLSIDTLNLTHKYYNILRRNGINKVGDLFPVSYSEIGQFSHLGRRGLDEVRGKLEALGVTLYEE
ncbi:MAG: hypothetical protein LBG83_04875 [Oscillospiraceae bacterium]|jgi:DNA-directed RNA polymerase alpha subunit|nr:hypothetical protein [Oscillospiraceae bacterium]